MPLRDARALGEFLGIMCDTPAKKAVPGSLFADSGIGLVYYLLTSFLVLSGGLFGSAFLRAPSTHGYVVDGGSGPFYANWDGQWYKSIAQCGYSFRRGVSSNITFFPAYPLFARCLAFWGIDFNAALLLTSNLCLVASFIILAAYTRSRAQPEWPDAIGYTVLALGLVPPSFFLRMAYSESQFLLLTLLTLLGIHRRWPVTIVAAIIGLASATRPTGVALLPVLLYNIRARYPDARVWIPCALGLLPIATWGLLTYMGFLEAKFGDPLLFVKSQAYWNKHPNDSLVDKAWSMLTLRPVWCRVVSSSPAYWALHDRQGMPLFSLYLADPVYFISTSLLVLMGGLKRWLNTSEILLAIGLIIMPILFKCHETDMEGFGRYAISVVPVYLVIGRALCHMPAPMVAGIFCVSGFTMAAYAALFAKWYMMI